MRYFVHGPDGTKFGPADLPTLQLWKSENRITPTTILEPEVGGDTIEARNLAGLFPEFQPQENYAQPSQPYVPYPTSQVDNSAQAKSLATATWILGAVSVVVCPLLLGGAAIVCAVLASQKGHPQGKILIGYAIGCTVFGFCLGIALWTAMQGLTNQISPR